MGGGGGRPMNPMRGPDVSDEPPDDAEWERIQAFMKQNMPNRFEIFSRMRNDSAPGGRGDMFENVMRRRAASRYRAMEHLRQTQPTMFSFAITGMQLEDKLFGQFRSLAAEGADRDAIRATIRQTAAELVDNRFAEREARIAELEKIVAEEKSRLSNDREARDAFVDRANKRAEEDFDRTNRRRDGRD
jgi:hypothetical protein